MSQRPVALLRQPVMLHPSKAARPLSSGRKNCYALAMLDSQGQILVRIARESVDEALGGPRVFIPGEAWLKEAAATFVTIARSGTLHGCIGSLEPHRPLWKDVQKNALAAAFEDPRAGSLVHADMGELLFEVSLLSPRSPIHFSGEEDAIQKLRPNIDGVLLTWTHYRGVFLPQVWERIEGPREFLQHLKIKAGLPTHFWAPDVKLERFTVQEWHEPGFSLG